MATDSEIVISGISGRFPECNNVEEFRTALMNGTDLVTDDDRRYPIAWAKLNGLPIGSGKIPALDKFDALFFGIHAKLAHSSDPRHRILLEATFEAIMDAGFNPTELRGSNTGVYVAISSVSNPNVITDQSDGYASMGLRASNAANSISFCFDFHGTSYAVDTACSSALQVLSQAFTDMEEGRVENAIVCGSNINLFVKETQQFNNINFLGANGRCRTFSKLRDGFTRSESVNALLLQRKSKSRRIYATVLGCGVNIDGWKEEGITYPSCQMQTELLKSEYLKSNISPDDVTYVELHGTGTIVGDQNECQVIVNVYGDNRKNPLPVGSVKSNMGHSENAAAFCGITKAILIFENGIIPANLHTDPIDENLVGIRDQKIKVVSENMPWTEGLIAVNSFGFQGTNGHCILKPNNKKKVSTYTKPTNRLVQVSGRTEETVNYFLNEIEKNENDAEFLSLLDEIHKNNIDGHNFRGYTVLGENSTREIAKYSPGKRPLWFLYSGMGSQWVGMGRDLLNIEVFKNSFYRCAAAVSSYGVDLIDVILNGSDKDINRLVVTFTGISAINIALTDLLLYLGIQPDYFGGHSLGEVGCAYLNGDITPEQAMLLAYSRGLANEKAKPIPGQMAAVGMSVDEISKILPDDIYVACQNNKFTVTISGPKESTRIFVNDLISKGVFARFVQSCDTAFHTKYVKESGKFFDEYCRKILTDPKPRSSKWITSSVRQEQSNEKWAKYNCVEYHLNNFLNTVLFDQVLEKIPENAIVVEIAPTGLLQSIIKKQLGSKPTVFPLMSKADQNQEQFLLAAIGKIYNAGGQPQLRKLYNEVSFPVSRGTTMISPMLKWDHSASWHVPYWKHQDAYGEVVTINLSESRWEYLKGHVMDGRILLPGAEYLVQVWRVKAKLVLKELDELPIIFRDVKFIRATILTENTDVNLLINITKATGYFEIFEGGSLCVSGTISTTEDISKEFMVNHIETHLDHGSLEMNREDFYKEVRLRSMLYKGPFKMISSSDITSRHGEIEWLGNYTCFIDCLLQIQILDHCDRELRIVSQFEKLTLDPHVHLTDAKNKYIKFTRDPHYNVTRTKGIELFNTRLILTPRRPYSDSEPLLESYEFVPYDSSLNQNYDINISLKIALEIVVQNIPFVRKNLMVGDLTEGNDDIIKKSNLEAILREKVAAITDYTKLNLSESSFECDIIVLTDALLKTTNIELLKKHMKYESFIIVIGKSDSHPEELKIIFKSAVLSLLRLNCDFPEKYCTINIRNADFNWLIEVQDQVRKANDQTVYLFNQTEETSGIVGLTKCLLSECKSIFIKSVLTDKEADEFSVDKAMYRDQLSTKLTLNVYRNKVWGTYIHLPIQEPEMKYTNNASVALKTLGDLSTLTWMERPIFYSNEEENSDIVNIHCTALNYRDIMLATGKLRIKTCFDPTDLPISIGMDYSGITESGKRVMGMVLKEGLAFQTKSLPYYTFNVPESWTLEEASTVPVVYLTCYYALIMRGQMEEGESILIHAGAGGVGIAAISIALSLNATIFTTVSSQEKKDFLLKLYPQLDEENIGCSRDSSFEQLILKKTNGKGVDLVLNSLAGDLLRASLRCIGKGGRFLEIGKVDFFKGTLLDSYVFLKNCSFHGILLDEVFCTNISKRLNKLFNEGIAKGVVKPLPLYIFDHTEMESAFRFLASGKHKGKVVIKIRKNEKEILPKILAHPKVYFNPQRVYIITGGHGGLGLELTDWMISRGATHIILNVRRKIWNGFQAFCLKKWSKLDGINVKLNLSDTTTLEGAEKLIQEAQEVAPVAGIFNLAIVLREGYIINQTSANFEDVFKPKVNSSENLDEISRNKCPFLQHFVIFSSATCGRGNLMQSNYGMANSALEMLCEKRRRDNLPALAVQYGPVKDVGALAEISLTEKRVFYMGFQSPSSCIEALEKFMLTNTIIGSSNILFKEDQSVTTPVSVKSPAASVAHILGLKDLDSIDQTKTLSRLGLDSIMTTEMQQILYRNFDLDFEQEQIRNLTFEYLLGLKASGRTAEK